MFNHKEITIDLETWFLVAVVIVITIVLTRIFRWLINQSFVTASEKLRVDPTRYKFFKNAVSLIMWMVAAGVIVSLVPKLKALAITLFAGAGILVAILGFAAQEAFANIVGGVFIVIFKPFRVGDMIKVGDRDYGIVEDITLRHTVINNFQNKRIIIPNSVISSETITNDTIADQKICRWIEFGISYDSSIDLATKIIQEEAQKHELSIDNRTPEEIENGEPEIVVRVISFGDSSVMLRAYVWTSDAFNAFRMHSDLNKSIKLRFDKEGVEIPFPYRTVVYKKDLPPNSKAGDGRE